MYPRLLQLGHFAIPTYGAFTALALIASLAALLTLARRFRLDPNIIWNFGLMAILTTLIAARLLLIVFYFGAFRQHPFWVLGLTAIHGQWINMLAILIGFAAALLYAAAEGLSIAQTLDCIAPAAALAIGINRIGAFVAGIDYGVAATHSWGVTYTSRIAAFWYHTPLGIPLVPIQLYEAVLAFATLVLLLWWMPRRRRPGEIFGAWLFLAGFPAFFLDAGHAAIQTAWVLPGAVQGAMVAASAFFLLYRKPYTVEDASTPA